MKAFSIVVAVLMPDRGIGKNGTIPWRIPSDLKYFKQITSKISNPNQMNCCIMGRKTYLGIPSKFRPLPQRLNLVLSRDIEKTKETIGNNEVLVCTSLQGALDLLNNEPWKEKIENIFVIGGGEIYQQAIQHPLCEKIYITSIFSLTHRIECDTFFPNIPEKEFTLQTPQNETPTLTENGFSFQFLIYERIC